MEINNALTKHDMFNCIQ